MKLEDNLKTLVTGMVKYTKYIIYKSNCFKNDIVNNIYGLIFMVFED